MGSGCWGLLTAGSFPTRSRRGGGWGRSHEASDGRRRRSGASPRHWCFPIRRARARLRGARRSGHGPIPGVLGTCPPSGHQACADHPVPSHQPHQSQGEQRSVRTPVLIGCVSVGMRVGLCRAVPACLSPRADSHPPLSDIRLPLPAELATITTLIKDSVSSLRYK